MKADDHKQSDLSSQQVQQALLRASAKARLLAEQTGTKFVVRKPDAATTNAGIAQTLSDDN